MVHFRLVKQRANVSCHKCEVLIEREFWDVLLKKLRAMGLTQVTWTVELWMVLLYKCRVMGHLIYQYERVSSAAETFKARVLRSFVQRWGEVAWKSRFEPQVSAPTGNMIAYWLELLAFALLRAEIENFIPLAKTYLDQQHNKTKESSYIVATSYKTSHCWIGRYFLSFDGLLAPDFYVDNQNFGCRFSGSSVYGNGLAPETKGPFTPSVSVNWWLCSPAC